MKSGVELRSTDDRMCSDCFDENERQLCQQSANLAPASNGTKQRKKQLSQQPKRTTATATVTSADQLSTDQSIPINAFTLIQPSSAVSPLIASHTCTQCQMNNTSMNECINRLSATVAEQSEIIDKLSSQLNFVLSFLGIVENSGGLLGANSETKHGQANSPITADHADALADAPRSFADVVQQSIYQYTKSQSLNNQNDAVAAMYIESENKARRANSFIISGLPSDAQTSDSELTKQLCHNEFDLSIEVTSSKRIGKPTTNQPQRLLVHIKSRDQAQAIIQIARCLRKSVKPEVRENIFINPNLTKAEAKVQFELRQQRRANHSDRRRQNVQSQGKADIDSDYTRPVTHVAVQQLSATGINDGRPATN